MEGQFKRVRGEPPVSEVLESELRAEEGWPRLYDQATGHRLSTPDKEAEARQTAEARSR